MTTRHILALACLALCASPALADGQSVEAPTQPAAKAQPPVQSAKPEARPEAIVAKTTPAAPSAKPEAKPEAAPRTSGAR